MGSDVPAEQRLQGFDPLRCCAAQVYVRENFLGDVHLLRYAGLPGALIGEVPSILLSRAGEVVARRERLGSSGAG